MKAYLYQLGSRSAVEGIITRYWITTDKPSGIVNDPHDPSRESVTRATSSICSTESSRGRGRP